MARTIKKWPRTDNIDYQEKANIINGLIDVLKWISPHINPACGQMAPPSDILMDGFLAYANGDAVSGWDPTGAGTKGLFRYNTATSAWVNVG